MLALNDQLKPAAALKGVDFALPDPQPVAAWPLPGGNAEQSVDHVAAAANFEIAWRRKVGEGRSRAHHVTATPVIAAGRIFTMDGEARVSARDERTGSEVWSVDLSPRSIAVSAALLVLAGLLGSLVAFRRVTSVEPAVALGVEG